MEVTSKAKISELQIPKKWKDRNTSPERTKVWTERKPKSERKVSVVYYLSRNGQLEHPHFMEVPLSSPQGLHLRDVINRLNLLRGKGMPSLYSWSAKRSYKNGFVWHDLSENDFIYPTQGQEYILKGSEILEHASIQRPFETASSRSLRPPDDIRKSEDESDFPVITRRRNQSWSSIDLNEYRVYKSESSGDSSGKLAADASTQTDDERRRRRVVREEKEIEVEGERIPEARVIGHSQSTELSREEISPPPSDSSPETLETLMNADGRLALSSSRIDKDGANLSAAYNYPSGRMKASSVLIQLLSCGSISFKDCEPNPNKDHGLCMVGNHKPRLVRGAGNQTTKETGTSIEIPDLSGLRLEDKEYFSGSLIETKKPDFLALKRSSSYNADSGSQLQITEGGDAARAKCMPRKSKKENSGSKRIEAQQSM
ncbi:protein SOSEKI 5 [Prosopis cineraria]|uniref:protein SOSEKI 5 n=1 Tax=Prosopis cineraria TaxID=364024 RepID=UPI00240F6DD8|nr:protein SOSEKI 5 [Prosopis cineraria]